MCRIGGLRRVLVGNTLNRGCGFSSEKVESTVVSYCTNPSTRNLLRSPQHILGYPRPLISPNGSEKSCLGTVVLLILSSYASQGVLWA